MAAITIFPLSSSINFRRCTPCKPKDVTACKSVIKSVTETSKVPVPPEPIVRRSANYKPSKWDNNFLQSLKTEYTGEAINARASELKEEVRMIFNNVVEPLDQLELIDQLQRLGLDYHFRDEINRTLKKIHTGQKNETWEKDLHATALEFRLLRQHGHYITPEGFKRFTENGIFSKGICSDVQGLLSLYEASYFSMEGESLMKEAWSFTSNKLKECLESIIDLDLQMQVRHALELPLQWRIPRFDVRWYINLYQRRGDTIPAVLEFAKLDFNIRQALNQDELKDLSRWDTIAMKELPDYMKLCFLLLINVVNETTYDILKNHNIDTFPHQKKWFNVLFERYIVEARWYNSGYQPTLDEYLKNGFVSVGAPIVVLYSYISSEDPNKKEGLEFIEDLPDIVRLACEILRLADDYGTSSDELKRGDVPSAIHCYMSDTGVTEEVSREHTMHLIRKKWAQVNKLRFSKEDVNPLSWSFVDIMLNISRVGHCLYNDGDDGYGVEDVVTKETFVSLLVEPIPLRN